MRLLVSIIAAACIAHGDDFTVGGDYRAQLQAYLTQLAEAGWTRNARDLSSIKTVEELRRRQEFVRKWTTDAIGGLPSQKTPLNPRITGSFTREGYRVEKLIFESLPGFYVTANVYVPTHGKAPYPAVLGVAGHSDTGKAIGTYQHAWIGLVKRGFIVIAFDPPGQGERLQYVDPTSGKSTVGVGTREHTMAGTQCLLTGTTLARYEIWDGIRAFDYLLTRKDVDPKRIAVAGNSGGGTQSAYLAVMEPRLASAEVSCYMTSWATLWSGPGPQDAEQIFPGMLRDGLDFPDLLLAMAPRPVEMSVAIRDFFPIAGARSTYAALRRLYSVADAEVKASYFEHDDEHGWSKPRREAMYRFFSKWLQGREDNSAEPPITPEPEGELNATATGQVATLLRGETVQSLNQALAEKMFPSRTAARTRDSEELRRVIARRLGVALPVPLAQVSMKREFIHEKYKGEQLTLTTEPGIEVPGVLFRPGANREETYPATLLLDGRGKAESWPQIEELLRQGHLVLALDVRGIGEAGVAATGKGYTPEYQLAMRAVLVGKNMVGMQTTDILAAIAYLKSRPDVSAVSLRASGRVGVAALCAAALQPAVAESVIQLPIVSYMEFARARLHDSLISLAVPGVLRDFDLPDVAALVAPRRLTISADGDRRVVEREFAPAYSAYRRAGASEAFKTASDPQ